MKKTNLKIINAIVAGALVTSVFITIITLATEIFSPVKTWLKTVTVHHWVSKSAIGLGIFFVISFIVYFIPDKLNEEKLQKRILLLFWLTLIGVLVIGGYYSYHFWLA